MAEMNGRMNGSQIFPPPALCLRFPALQSCREDLPLVLQKPDNFPLVMGILQEINHEKVGFSSQMDSTFIMSQRPRDQQIPMLTLTKVKLENIEAEDQHQPSCSSNPDLYQEWSLKGVEELLTISEEFRLRHDCYQQAHDSDESLDLSLAQEEKPSSGLQSTYSQVNQRSSDEALLHGDEKLALRSRQQSFFEEQVPYQGRVSSIRDLSEAHCGLMALEAAVLANNKTRFQQAQACVENSLGLDMLQLVKREFDGHGCHSEAEMPDLPAEHILTPSDGMQDGMQAKENAHHMTLKQSKDKIICNTDTQVNIKSSEVPPAREDLSSGLCEEGETSLNLKDKLAMDIDHEFNNHKKTSPKLNFETEAIKKWTVQNVLRTTSTILALPSDFTEEEKIQVSHKPPSTSNSSMAEGPMSRVISFEGADSQQISIDYNRDQKHHMVSSEVDRDFCTLTLSLGSSQRGTTTCPKILDFHSLHEGKPVAKNLLVQEGHHGQCQRTNTNQWQQATRCGSYKVYSSPAAHNERAPFPPTECGCKLGDCYADKEKSPRMVRITPKNLSFHDSSSDEMGTKMCQFKEGHPSALAGNHATALAGNHATVNKRRSLDGGVSRKMLQLMPQSSEDEDSALAGVVEKQPSENDQLAEPNSKIGERSSKLLASPVRLQSEQASEFKEPDKKMMRGTLPMQEKRNGAHQKGSLDGGVCRKALQLMPQSSEDEDSDLAVVVEEQPSENNQLAEPNPKIGEGSSKLLAPPVCSQSEQAFDFKEPDKKRMRGTLPMQEKGDGAHHKEKDTRCHRSDGKSWRCVRECINGAYYCQYHLRARRIGYNRRKKRDTDMGPCDESVRNKSHKSRKKSKQLLSTSNRNPTS